MLILFRLVSEKTVEENILKKANQKRMLGDVAIEGGNFTTAYFKSVSIIYLSLLIKTKSGYGKNNSSSCKLQSTIQDLFNVDTSENDASRRMCEVLQRDAEKRNSCESSMVKLKFLNTVISFSFSVFSCLTSLQ